MEGIKGEKEEDDKRGRDRKKGFVPFSALVPTFWHRWAQHETGGREIIWTLYF